MSYQGSRQAEVNAGFAWLQSPALPTAPPTLSPYFFYEEAGDAEKYLNNSQNYSYLNAYLGEHKISEAWETTSEESSKRMSMKEGRKLAEERIFSYLISMNDLP